MLMQPAGWLLVTLLCINTLGWGYPALAIPGCGSSSSGPTWTKGCQALAQSGLQAVQLWLAVKLWISAQLWLNTLGCGLPALA